MCAPSFHNNSSDLPPKEILHVRRREKNPWTKQKHSCLDHMPFIEKASLTDTERKRDKLRLLTGSDMSTGNLAVLTTKTPLCGTGLDGTTVNH